MNSYFPIVLCLVGASALGCSVSVSTKAPAEPPSPAPVVAAPTPTPAPTPPADPDDVHIDGDHLVIDRHINFASDSHEILEDSFDLLDHIAQLLKNHPEIKTMHVIGHTDASGSAEHNLQLSNRRANSVMAALQSRGVTQTLDADGKGKTQPICTESTPECHRKNRRVEFLIEK